MNTPHLEQKYSKGPMTFPNTPVYINRKTSPLCVVLFTTQATVELFCKSCKNIIVCNIHLVFSMYRS